MVLFYLERQQTLFLHPFLIKTKDKKKLQLFHQNHGLSPLQKCQFSILFESMFILFRKACFLTRTSPNTFSGCILHKTKRYQKFKFLTKTMDYPLCKNAIFAFFLNPCLYCVERLVF